MSRGAVSAAFLAILSVASPAGVRPDAPPERVILRLADGSARVRLLAEATGAPFTLEARHAYVVRGLRDVHAASLAGARSALDRARAAGALRELDRLWAVNAVVAEVDPAWIAALEADPAIESVEPDRRLTLGAASSPAVTSAPADATDDLMRIGVPEVWAQGIFGQGTIVANTDSGVNGEDDTLEDRWRGLFAGSDATWYAPTALTVFPNDDGGLISFGHGTATMGVMTGGESSFGVAYGATWIAGDVFERDDGFVSTALKTLEWLIDPDGDPSSTTDVPDVVSNSYGLRDRDPQTNRIRCDDIFDAAIDALEAAGVIVIWSAGNEGQSGVTSPASRADSPVNAFAVGAVDAQNQPTAGSGIGPSACGGPHVTKPEVVAPGRDIETRSRFNSPITVSGTSFATPMVGGVLALMRSKNPAITPEAAKTILLDTADDVGAPGDDNSTGRGVVDAVAAVAAVQRPTQPLARLVGYRPAGAPAGKVVPAGIEEALVLRPGGSLSLVPRLTNHGPALPATTGRLTSPTPGVTVTRATVDLEPAETGAFFGPSGEASLGVDVAASVPPGTPIVLDLAVEGAAVGPFRLVVQAGDPVAGGFATHDRGQVRLSVTNFGGLGYYTGLHSNGFILEGAGFQFPPGSPSWLFHAGFMAGTGADRLSDDIPYGEDTQAASDWIPVFGFPVTVDEAAGGQRISTAYDDRKAISALDLEVKQESFAFSDPGQDSFVLVRYTITNHSDLCRAGLRTGLFADWDLPGSAGDPRETAGWDAERLLGFVQGTLPGQPALGVVLLDQVSPDQATYAVLRRDEVIQSTKGNPDLVPAQAPDLFGGEFSDAEKWDALSSGLTRTSVTDPQDLYQIIGVGPFGLPSGTSHTVGIGLIAAETLEGLREAASTAKQLYAQNFASVPFPTCPGGDELELSQNYPNPFRAGRESTTIEFNVPVSGRVTLAVYDVLGRRVRTLLSGENQGGFHALTWDGFDERGERVPPGVYVIRLEAGDGALSVRALVLPR